MLASLIGCTALLIFTAEELPFGPVLMFLLLLHDSPKLNLKTQTVRVGKRAQRGLRARNPRKGRFLSGARVDWLLFLAGLLRGFVLTVAGQSNAAKRRIRSNILQLRLKAARRAAPTSLLRPIITHAAVTVRLQEHTAGLQLKQYYSRFRHITDLFFVVLKSIHLFNNN